MAVTRKDEPRPGEWRPQGDPEQVQIHDFVVPELGRAIPYGVYDLGQNTGWVSVGVDHDTSEFAVATIRRWWYSMGRPTYRQAKRLLITADAGGSNGPVTELCTRAPGDPGSWLRRGPPRRPGRAQEAPSLGLQVGSPAWQASCRLHAAPSARPS